jgi:glycerophosphoryl diester phosphodiesterase
MRLIAHRGNLNGSNKYEENTPDYIDKALRVGVDVEVDVWVIDNNILLGHDQGNIPITLDFLQERRDRLWCHAKNHEALVFLLKNDFHCFTHDIDDYTLTSKNVIWAYPGKRIDRNTVCVMPEKAPIKYTDEDLHSCYGICTDFVFFYLDNLEKKTI